MSVIELGEKLGIPNSTLHKRMVAIGCQKKNSKTKRWTEKDDKVTPIWRLLKNYQFKINNM